MLPEKTAQTVVKSTLIKRVAEHYDSLNPKDVETAINHILQRMSSALSSGQRIEIRGFGVFLLSYRPPRINARNPKTGKEVATIGKFIPRFKAGKNLKERVDQAK